MRRILQSDPDYAGMIWNLDWNIGRLLRALEESGQAENTVVIFTSDNGGLSTSEGSPTCNLPAREGKGWVEEGGIPRPADHPVSGQDPAWNKVRCAGDPRLIFTPPSLRLRAFRSERSSIATAGASCLSCWGRTMPEHPLFWHYPHYGNQGGVPGSAVRLGRYKLIESLEDHSLQLYDLETGFRRAAQPCG